MEARAIALVITGPPFCCSHPPINPLVICTHSWRSYLFSITFLATYDPWTTCSLGSLTSSLQTTYPTPTNYLHSHNLNLLITNDYNTSGIFVSSISHSKPPLIIPLFLHQKFHSQQFFDATTTSKLQLDLYLPWGLTSLITQLRFHRWSTTRVTPLLFSSCHFLAKP